MSRSLGQLLEGIHWTFSTCSACKSYNMVIICWLPQTERWCEKFFNLNKNWFGNTAKIFTVLRPNSGTGALGKYHLKAFIPLNGRILEFYQQAQYLEPTLVLNSLMIGKTIFSRISVEVVRACTDFHVKQRIPIFIKQN